MQNPEAGRALTRSILRANRGGLQGWPLVDAMMQKQIEAGVTTVEDWTAHLAAEGLEDSWRAWNANRENPALAFDHVHLTRRGNEQLTSGLVEPVADMAARRRKAK